MKKLLNILIGISLGITLSSQTMPYKALVKDNRCGIALNPSGKTVVDAEYDLLQFVPDSVTETTNGFSFTSRYITYTIKPGQAAEVAFAVSSGYPVIGATGNEWKTIDLSNGKAAKSVYEKLEYLPDLNILFRKNGKYGVMNKSLKIIINAFYDSISTPVSGLYTCHTSGKKFLYTSAGVQIMEGSDIYTDNYVLSFFNPANLKFTHVILAAKGEKRKHIVKSPIETFNETGELVWDTVRKEFIYFPSGSFNLIDIESGRLLFNNWVSELNIFLPNSKNSIYNLYDTISARLQMTTGAMAYGITGDSFTDTAFYLCSYKTPGEIRFFGHGARNEGYKKYVRHQVQDESGKLLNNEVILAQSDTVSVVYRFDTHPATLHVFQKIRTTALKANYTLLDPVTGNFEYYSNTFYIAENKGNSVLTNLVNIHQLPEKDICFQKQTRLLSIYPQIVKKGQYFGLAFYHLGKTQDSLHVVVPFEYDTIKTAVLGDITWFRCYRNGTEVMQVNRLGERINIPNGADAYYMHYDCPEYSDLYFNSDLFKYYNFVVAQHGGKTAVIRFDSIHKPVYSCGSSPYSNDTAFAGRFLFSKVRAHYNGKTILYDCELHRLTSDEYDDVVFVMDAYGILTFNTNGDQGIIAAEGKGCGFINFDDPCIFFTDYVIVKKNGKFGLLHYEKTNPDAIENITGPSPKTFKEKLPLVYDSITIEKKKEQYMFKCVIKGKTTWVPM